MRQKRNTVLWYGNLANYITLSGLLLALSGCFFALRGDLRLSVIFLICSGICDLFDGVAARKFKRTDLEKEFGVQLDTVVDVVSFGVTPVIVVFSVCGTAWYALAVYMYYIVCAVVRLAYYNTSVVSGWASSSYHGLPVTYIALILPVALLLRSAAASIVTLAVAGTLFVLKIKIPKPRGVWYLLFPVIAAALIALWCII